jgi:hypothetical protein
MKAHWTKRIYAFSRVNPYHPIKVLKDSYSPPPISKPLIIRGYLEFGSEWLRENFPIHYAGFLTTLMKMGKTSEYHSKGVVVIEQWKEEEQDRAARPSTRPIKDKAVWWQNLGYIRESASLQGAYGLHPASGTRLNTKFFDSYSQLVEYVLAHYPKAEFFGESIAIKAPKEVSKTKFYKVYFTRTS